MRGSSFRLYQVSRRALLFLTAAFVALEQRRVWDSGLTFAPSRFPVFWESDSLLSFPLSAEAVGGKAFSCGGCQPLRRFRRRGACQVSSVCEGRVAMRPSAPPLAEAASQKEAKKSAFVFRDSQQSISHEAFTDLEETSAEERQQIRSQRRNRPMSPARLLKNDSLRRALLGKEKFAQLIAKVEGSSLTEVADAPQHQTPSEDFSEVPVWVMRQAGRYLPEFRAVRRRHDFFTVCRDPLLAAEVTLQPLRRFPLLDAAIIFSDILVLPEAMGMPLSMKEGEGPKFEWRIESPEDVQKLDLTFDMEDKLGYVFDAVFTTVQKLQSQVPLIGFCGAPLTLLCYMVEGGGGGSTNYRKCKQFLLDFPNDAEKLLRQIASLAAVFLSKQIEAGAQVLQVFDTNAGYFSPEMYSRFGMPFMEQIAEAVSSRFPLVPIIAFPKGQPLTMPVDTKFSAISLGWTDSRETCVKTFQRSALSSVASSQALSSECTDKRNIPTNALALQGNLDPQVLYASDEAIIEETKKMVKAFGVGRYVANLGHGMEPGMDPQKLQVFLKAVKDAAAEEVALRKK